MKFEICILVVLVLFMLAGAIPVEQETQTVIFRTPVFIILLALLGVSLLVGSFKRELKLPNLGFHLSHLGALLILIGGGISYMSGVKFPFLLPMDEESIVREVTLKDGRVIDFGFGVALKKFEILRYKPDFALYRPDPIQNGKKGEEDYQLCGKARISTDGILDFGGCGKFKVTDVVENDGGRPGCTVHLTSESNEEIVLVERDEKSERHTLENGYVLKLLRPADKQYRAELRFVTDNNSTIEREMSVNKPADFNDWLFYLNSYDRWSLSYIVVTARRDPGRKTVITGILALMVGVAVIFYLGRPGKITGHTTGDASG